MVTGDSKPGRAYRQKFRVFVLTGEPYDVVSRLTYGLTERSTCIPATSHNAIGGYVWKGLVSTSLLHLHFYSRAKQF